jgi:hypothetical protein
MTNACRGHPDRTPIRTVGTLPLTSFAAGANAKAVQRMLGHASAAMTLDVYAGLFDDDLDGVADRMDALGRAAVAHPLPKAPVVDLASVRQRGTWQ